MAAHMGDLLDAWSIHVYWDFWDVGKINRRLLTEVRTIFSAIPAEQRRPLYVTEFGVRGLQTFEGEINTSPGLWPDGTSLEETTAAAFEEGWFMVRAMEVGYSGLAKWACIRRSTTTARGTTRSSARAARAGLYDRSTGSCNC